VSLLNNRGNEPLRVNITYRRPVFNELEIFEGYKSTTVATNLTFIPAVSNIIQLSGMSYKVMSVIHEMSETDYIVTTVYAEMSTPQFISMKPENDGS
jgi:hypothetical protein